MRNFLRFAVFATVLVAILVVVAGPLLARPLIAALVRGALPLDGGEVTIGVDIGPALLAGEVATLDIGGRDLRSGQASVGRVALTVTGFSIVDRSFRAIDGRFEDVDLRLADGTVAAVDRIEVHGPSDSMTATATLDAAATVTLIAGKLDAAGIAHDRVQLGGGGVEVSAAGQTVQATFEVRDGGLILVPQGPLPRLTLIAPVEDDAWRFTSASVTPLGLEIGATADANALLAR